MAIEPLEDRRVLASIAMPGVLTVTTTTDAHALNAASSPYFGAGNTAAGIFTVDTATTLAIPVVFRQQSGGAGEVFINGTLTDTAAPGAVPGITITTPGTINDDFADTSALVLNGGTAGIVTLGGAIGSTTPIKSLSITGATIDLNGGSITTAHDQTYTAAVVLGATTVLNSSGDNSIGGNITTTTDNAGPGGDAINISSPAPNAGGTLANIAGQVIVNGGAADVLNIYDDRDTNASATGDLTSTGLTGFGMGAGITYQGGLESVNLRLGSGANLALNVHSTAASTPVYVVGQNVGTVNVGDSNQVAGTLDLTSVRTLNFNDQNSDRGQTYVITNEAVARPGTPLQVLVLYHKAGTVEVNAGNQVGGQLVDDTFNLFLPTATDLPLSATLKFGGGASPGGYHNTLNVIASQSTTPTGFTYRAHVGLFGGQDLIQVQNVQVLHMYGSPVDSNDFANDANVSSVIIGGINADTLVGDLGQDILFGGGDTASTGDQLVGGGGGNLDFIFAEFRPRFNADGSVSFVQFPGSGNTVINAGGNTAVGLTPNTNINNASSVIQVNGRIDVVTWLTARFTSPSSTGSIFEQALSTDPVLSGLQAPPAGPAPVPVALLGSPTPGPTIAQLTQYVKSAYQDMLGRAADPSSLNAAVNALSNGLSRGAFAASLTHIAEYYAVNVVIPAYHNYLNRAPDAAGLAF